MQETQVWSLDQEDTLEKGMLPTLISGLSQEEQPHLQRAVAAQAKEGLEELVHIQGQKGRQWGDTPRPR